LARKAIILKIFMGGGFEKYNLRRTVDFQREVMAGINLVWKL
jgi:hypothetical protein